MHPVSARIWTKASNCHLWHCIIHSFWVGSLGPTHKPVRLASANFKGQCVLRVVGKKDWKCLKIGGVNAKWFPTTFNLPFWGRLGSQWFGVDIPILTLHDWLILHHPLAVLYRTMIGSQKSSAYRIVIFYDILYWGYITIINDLWPGTRYGLMMVNVDSAAGDVLPLTLWFLSECTSYAPSCLNWCLHVLAQMGVSHWVPDPNGLMYSNVTSLGSTHTTV